MTCTRSALAFGLAALLVIPFAAFAQQTNPVIRLKAQYETHRQKIDAEALATYSNVLVAVGKQLQQKADVPGYLLLKSEQTFLVKQQALPDGEDRTNLVSKLPVLDAPLSRIEADRNTKMANLLKQYILALEAQIRQFMTADKLDEAQAAGEVKSSAESTLAGLQSKLPKTSALATTSTPQTTNQPSSLTQGKWVSLKTVEPKDADGGEWFFKLYNHNEDITIDGEEYKREEFISAHAPSRITWNFERPITAFRARLALNPKKPGNVIFRVETDGGKIFASKPVIQKLSRNVNLTFKPTRTLVLITDTNGDISNDHSVWLRPEIR